jgi:hypothetical protein
MGKPCQHLVPRGGWLLVHVSTNGPHNGETRLEVGPTYATWQLVIDPSQQTQAIWQHTNEHTSTEQLPPN